MPFSVFVEVVVIEIKSDIRFDFDFNLQKVYVSFIKFFGFVFTLQH